MENEMKPAEQNIAEPPGFIFMTPWMLADVPEYFHPFIAELFKQGVIKLIMDCPDEIM